MPWPLASQEMPKNFAVNLKGKASSTFNNLLNYSSLQVRVLSAGMTHEQHGWFGNSRHHISIYNTNTFADFD